MSDVHDLLLVLDLRAGLPDDELDEARWHLGLGPQPGRLTAVTDFDEVVLDDNGAPVQDETGRIRVESMPRPLLAQRGATWRTGGASSAQLEPRDDGGWALLSRQELHPDDFDRVDRLLAWLAARTLPGSTPFAGYLRHIEDAGAGELLSIVDGELVRSR
jgi:hypothetical protein